MNVTFCHRASALTAVWLADRQDRQDRPSLWVGSVVLISGILVGLVWQSDLVYH